MARKELKIEDLTFLIDTREQLPLEFSYGPPDALKRIQTERATLTTGDYSVRGLDAPQIGISIERKSLEDLVMCCGRERERFEKEIARMLAFPCRLIVVEASWDEIEMGQWRGQIKPNQVMGSVQGWIALGIPFFFHHNRQTISNFVRNTMFIHARRCFTSLVDMTEGLKIQSEVKHGNKQRIICD